MTPIARIVLGLTATVFTGWAAAQATYPERSVHMIVGFPPGGPADTVARLLGQRLTDALQKPIVVDNVPGAAGTIATGRIVKAASDGYTLALVTEAQILINPGLYELPYEPAKDFEPISQITLSPYLLIVHNSVPVKSLKDLIGLARAQPSALTFASAGSGSTPHMAAELFKLATGVDMRHIPYKGLSPAITDLLGGRISIMFSPVATALPIVREGKLRALAVSSVRRSSAAPHFPSIAESGYPGFDVTGWLGLVAPAKAPPAIIHKLHAETTKALALPELREKLANQGMETIGSSPEAFTELIRSGIPKWAKIIRDSGTKLE
jgi:tripartite-type tricarboxylate transporter receptor subunit TctC